MRKLQEDLATVGFYEQNKNWIDGIAIALGVQAILGIIAIEYAFARNKRFMYDKDEERDEKFKAFRRLDTDRWYRFKFYPGAMFSMPSRLLLLILEGIITVIIAKIILCGHDYRKGPVTDGCRKRFIELYSGVYGKIWMFLSGYCCPSIVEIDADYSEWLGPDYKEQYDKSIKMTSTVISNHVTQNDPFAIYQYIHHAMTLDIGFKDIPVMGGMAKAVGSLFIPRGGSDEQR